jgi:hypothetical protein
MMTSFAGYWSTRGRPHCLARWPSSSFGRWLVEPGGGPPFVGPAAAMRVDRHSLIMMEEARSLNTFFRPITDKAISPTFVFLHRDGAWRTFERSGAFSEAVPALLGAATCRRSFVCPFLSFSPNGLRHPQPWEYRSMDRDASRHGAGWKIASTGRSAARFVRPQPISPHLYARITRRRISIRSFVELSIYLSQFFFWLRLRYSTNGEARFPTISRRCQVGVLC